MPVVDDIYEGWSLERPVIPGRADLIERAGGRSGSQVEARELAKVV